MIGHAKLALGVSIFAVVIACINLVFSNINGISKTSAVVIFCSAIAILCANIANYRSKKSTGPSVASLWKRAKALNASINYFFHDLEEENTIVRRNERKKIQLQNSNITYELLCPNLKKQNKMLMIEIEPGKCLRY